MAFSYNLRNFNPERSVGYLIRRVGKLSTAQIEHRFVDSDLTLTHWIALAMLKRGIVDNCAGLSRQIGHNSGATTRLVDQLEARGLVQRRRVGDDRRVVTLAVTPTGLQQFQVLTPIVLEAWNDALVDFEANEVETLISLLSRLVGALEARESAAETVSA